MAPIKAYQFQFTRTLKKVHPIWGKLSSLETPTPDLVGVPKTMRAWFFDPKLLLPLLRHWNNETWDFSLSSNDIEFNLKQKPEIPPGDAYIHYQI